MDPRRGGRGPGRDERDPHARARRPRLARPPRGPERRRPPHRRERLRDPAPLLARQRARGPAARADVQRMGDGEVSPWLAREARAGDPWRSAAPAAARSPGTSRTAGRCCSSRAAPGWCRCGRCCATASTRAAALDTRLLLSVRTEEDQLYAAEIEAWRAAGVQRWSPSPAPAGAGSTPPCWPSGPAAGGPPARVRVRPDRVRRGRRHAPAARRPRHRASADRALRRRGMSLLPSPA